MSATVKVTISRPLIGSGCLFPTFFSGSGAKYYSVHNLCSYTKSHSSIPHPSTIQPRSQASIYSFFSSAAYRTRTANRVIPKGPRHIHLSLRPLNFAFLSLLQYSPPPCFALYQHAVLFALSDKSKDVIHGPSQIHPPLQQLPFPRKVQPLLEHKQRPPPQPPPHRVSSSHL